MIHIIVNTASIQNKIYFHVMASLYHGSSRFLWFLLVKCLWYVVRLYVWRTCGMFEKQQFTWAVLLKDLPSPDMLIIKRPSMAPLSHLHGNSRGHDCGWHQVADGEDEGESTIERNRDEREGELQRFICLCLSAKPSWSSPPDES